MNFEPSEHIPTAATVAGISPNPPKTGRNPARSQVTTLLATILTTCFFIPWFRLLFTDISGYMLQDGSKGIKIVWAMPIFSAITVVAGLSGKSQQLPGLLAGLTPFAFLAYALRDNGAGFFQVIRPGGWIALFSGIMLIVLAIAPNRPR